MIELFSIDKDFSEDEKRIFFSAAFSFLIFSLVAAHLYTKNLLFDVFRDKKASSLAVKDKENEKLYHVLLEQIERDKKKDKEIKALSDEDSTGSGGITKEKGFHTL
ncbi:MAG: TonB-dependent receptor, partial [Leptospiraceae bacterium]|nr:TonB-dependent receptor [Leptospiraceae bacterium]